jgi:MFS family permease
LFLFNMTNNMVAPLVPTLLVNQLRLSDALIGVGTALSNILVLIVSLGIAGVTRRTGNRRATVVGAGLLAFHAFALALSRDATLYIVATIIAGVATGILNAAQYNYHLDNVPQAERSAWLSWALLFGNAAVLMGSLAGPAVARVNGTAEALYIFGGLRFLVALLILRWG